MSGICGHIDLERALHDTPEFSSTVVRHAESGCVATADATLYYRDELLAALGLVDKEPKDGELILQAYLRWGRRCVDRLQGDFAFVIWDPRERMLLCARDPYGMRPFCYHYAPDNKFVFASDARDVVRHPQVPFAINGGRIADFIVPELEWIDYTSTFYEGVLRLPPGHSLTIDSGGMHVSEYWVPRTGPELKCSTDQEYCEAFREVFSRAITERLRTAQGKVGATLSGGMDSGSVVAIANGRAQPISLTRQRGSQCTESSRIHATLDHLGLEGIQVIADDPACLIDTLSEDLEEPFDGEMLFLKALYFAAQRAGIEVVLDGAAGDLVFNEGTYIPRLLRRGHLRQAWRETMGELVYWEMPSSGRAFLRYLAGAFTPEVIKSPLRQPRGWWRERKSIYGSLIDREFADRVDIRERFERMRETFSGLRSNDPGLERVRKIRPNLTAGRERYARIAASVGIEARDPFADQRVIDFCSRLPDEQCARNGWPKYLLRMAMDGLLPDEVRWGTGKPHIGGLYNETFCRQEKSTGELTIERLQTTLRGYVNPGALRHAWREFDAGGNHEPIHSAHILSLWLTHSVTQPIVKDQGFR